MIINREVLEEFEREYLRRHPLTHEAALRLMDGLLEEARALGVWPPKDPWEGVDVDIRMAKILCKPLK